MSRQSVSSDQSFPVIVLWETLENAPMLIGFLLAVRIRSEDLPLAFVCLFASMALGAAMIHFTEAYKYSNQPTLKETFTNFAVFTILAIPFLFYFSSENAWWSNWVSDLILGLGAGIVLAVGESRGWKDTSNLRRHAISMAISAVLFLLGIRLIYQIEALPTLLGVGLVFTILISILIIRLEYWPVKSPDSTPSSHEP